MIDKPIRLAAAMLSVVLFAGCGERPPTISGVATYEGKKIATGAIRFVPADGQGTPFGGLIRDGEYQVDSGYTGKKKVSISGYDVPIYEGRKVVNSTGSEFTEETVPEDAVGNSQEVEIKPGHQTLDFHLTAPQ